MHCLPVGNAGNITAYWQGYVEYADDGRCDARPGCGASRPPAPRRSCPGDRVDDPDTVATAIRIGDPASWARRVAARDESGGVIEAVTDEQILAAHRLLSAREGVFVEPASAASVAGLLQCHEQGVLDPGQLVVCTVPATGSRTPRRRCRG